MALEQLLEDIVRRVVREEIAVALATVKQDSAPDVLTVDEAAAFAKVHHTTIREWVKDGSLSARKPGRRIRINRVDLVARINRASVIAGEPVVVDIKAMAARFAAGQRR